MRLLWPVVSLAFLLASGCASVGGASRRDGMDVLRSCDVSCSGSIGAERTSAAPADAAPAGQAGAFHANVRLARVPVATADWLLRGDAHAADAFVVTTASADRVLSGSAALPAAHDFATADRAAGVVAVEHARSFIERFDFSESDAAAIVDPVVGVYTIGNRLTLLPRRNDDGDSWTVELALRSVDVDRPELIAKVGVLGAGTPIRFDVPILARVETRTAATLARGESLVVVSPELLQDDHVVVAIVTPD